MTKFTMSFHLQEIMNNTQLIGYRASFAYKGTTIISKCFVPDEINLCDLKPITQELGHNITSEHLKKVFGDVDIISRALTIEKIKSIRPS